MSHDRNQKRRRCGLCNDETADQLGVAFDNTAIAPFAITDVDGVRHRFEILGDLEADAHDLFTRLRDRIRQALSVRHVEETEMAAHAAASTQPRHRVGSRR
ncbi:MAG: hypothetical protein IT179_21975 [Acidobacteria bacterium]|nr:hypothetical protein [Acidobacteriota bacterium]